MGGDGRGVSGRAGGKHGEDGNDEHSNNRGDDSNKKKEKDKRRRGHFLTCQR